GYLIVDGKKHKLQANDVYLLEPGSSHEYYADKDDPYKKVEMPFATWSWRESSWSIQRGTISCPPPTL
nr:AraC family ligand binding domain-containing protein [Alistipes sp.]